MAGGADVTVNGVTVAFAGRPAVDGVSFSARRGDCVGIVGESGSGKSTLLRALCGMHPTSAGRIMLDGEDVRRSAATRLRLARTVQMVFQDPYGSLHPARTIGKTLDEPLRIHGEPSPAGRVSAALEEVGLDPALAERFPHQLSGGQRQRVAIARALMLRPRILLLDEPTSALDVSVQAGVLNLLRRLQEQTGVTLILVSHNLAVIAHLCPRVLVMAEGRIVEDMSRDHLVNGQAQSAQARVLVAAASRRSAPAAFPV